MSICRPQGVPERGVALHGVQDVLEVVDGCGQGGLSVYHCTSGGGNLASGGRPGSCQGHHCRRLPGQFHSTLCGVPAPRSARTHSLPWCWRPGWSPAAGPPGPVPGSRPRPPAGRPPCTRGAGTWRTATVSYRQVHSLASPYPVSEKCCSRAPIRSRPTPAPWWDGDTIRFFTSTVSFVRCIAAQNPATRRLSELF